MLTNIKSFISIMDIEQGAALGVCLVHLCLKRKQQPYLVLQEHSMYREFHQLIQGLKTDEDRFQEYLQVFFSPKLSASHC